MSLDALGTAPVDAPDRQHTLRATVDWSIGLLDPEERSLLESMAVFVDGWTVPAAAEVAAVDEDRALDLTEALARHSLVVVGGRQPVSDAEHNPCVRRRASRGTPGHSRHRPPSRRLLRRGWPPRRTCRCAGYIKTYGPNACRSRRQTSRRPCAGTSTMTRGRFRTCSACCRCSGSCAITWPKPARGSTRCCRSPTPWTPCRERNCCGRRRSSSPTSATTRRRRPPDSD